MKRVLCVARLYRSQGESTEDAGAASTRATSRVPARCRFVVSMFRAPPPPPSRRCSTSRRRRMTTMAATHSAGSSSTCSLQQAAVIKRVCVALLRASSYGSTPDDTSLCELDLIIGCVVALLRMLWQLKDSERRCSTRYWWCLRTGTHGNATRWRCSRAARSRCSSPTASTKHRCSARLCCCLDALQRALDLARYALETLQCAVPSELQISFGMPILQQSEDAVDVRWSKRLPLARYSTSGSTRCSTRR